MPNLAKRIVARIRALFPSHWTGEAGQRFRKTASDFTAAVKEAAPPEQMGELAAESFRRIAVGKISREHAEAVKNYAKEEALRIETELAKRVLVDRERQESAKATQEEIKARTLKTQELMARLKLFDELEKRGALAIWDADGNMTIVKAPPTFDWSKARERLFVLEELKPELLGEDSLDEAEIEE